MQRLLPRHLCHALTAKAYALGGVAFELPLSGDVQEQPLHVTCVIKQFCTWELGPKPMFAAAERFFQNVESMERNSLPLTSADFRSNSHSKATSVVWPPSAAVPGLGLA